MARIKGVHRTKWSLTWLRPPTLASRGASTQTFEESAEQPEASYPRDLVGYGPNPPHARWLGGARIAVQFVLNYEERAEIRTRGAGLVLAEQAENIGLPHQLGAKAQGHRGVSVVAVLVQVTGATVAAHGACPVRNDEPQRPSQ